MRRVAAVLAGLAICVTMSSCVRMDEAKIKELAELKQECNESGGKFRQWYDGFNNLNWDCDFYDKT
jgi:hypothetical protein